MLRVHNKIHKKRYQIQQDMVELAMTLEDLLDIEVPDDAVKDLKLHDVDNLIKFVKAQ